MADEHLIGALVGFVACPVAMRHAQADFLHHWEALRKVSNVRAGCRIVFGRIAARAVEKAQQMHAGADAMPDATVMVAQLETLIAAHFEPLRERAILELGGGTCSASPRVQDALEKQGVLLHVVEPQRGATTPLRGSKQRAPSRKQQTPRNLSSFCMATLVLIALWAPRVHTLDEIPPTLVTAMVRSRSHFARWFPALVDKTPRYTPRGDPLWIEHSLCIGLYRLALDDASKERMGDSAAALHASPTTSSGGSPASVGSDVDSDADSDSDTESAPPVSDSVLRRINEWRVSKRTRPDEYTRTHAQTFFTDTPETAPCDAMLVSDDDDDDGDNCSDAGNDWSHSVDQDWARRLDTVPDTCSASAASSYVTALHQRSTAFQRDNVMYASRVSDRVRAVIVDAATSSGAPSTERVWRATRFHPFATSAAVFATAAAFAHAFLADQAHAMAARSCGACSGAFVDRTAPPTTLDGDARAEAHHATFWYYRIHWISANASDREGAVRTLRMTESAQASAAMLRRHEHGAAGCVSCAFVVAFTRVLARHARSHYESTLGVGTCGGGHGTEVVLGPHDVFCAECYWTEGARFFEHAFNLLNASRRERAQHYGVALCPDVERSQGNTGASALAVRDVPPTLADTLLTNAERRTVSNYCVLEAPSALGGVVASSVAHFTTRSAQGRPGLLNTTPTQGGRAVAVAVERNDLAAMQHAVAPIVALDRRCYMDTRDMHRCSGALTALRNVLCGTPHELYYGMQWLRRCLFRRARHDGGMLSPTAYNSGITLYRMLPRLLAALPPDALVDALASPYYERNQLLVRNVADNEAREVVAGVELFYADTVDLQRVTRNLHSDLFLLRRNRRLAEIIPRRYDLRFVRDRQSAATKVRSRRGRAAKTRALLAVHAAELRVRTGTLEQLRSMLVCDSRHRSRSSLKLSSKTVFAKQFRRLLNHRHKAALRSSAAQNQPDTLSVRVAAVLASIDPQPARTKDAASPSESTAADAKKPNAYQQAISGVTLLTPRALAFASAVRKTRTSIYASLYAFMLPVGARICASGPTLSRVWTMLMENQTLWRDHRMLAAFLSEIILSSSAERARIRALFRQSNSQPHAIAYGRHNHIHGGRGRDVTPLTEPAWMTWVQQRREYVFRRLESECRAQQRTSDDAPKSTGRGSRAADDASSEPSWRVFDMDGVDARGSYTDGKTTQRPRVSPLGRADQWCPCTACSRVSARNSPNESATVTCAPRSKFDPLPPLPWGAPDRFKHSFEHAQQRAEKQCPGIPEQHLILPQAVACFPDLSIPVHYLLYQFAVDPRVPSELRRALFLGVKALPRSGRMECVSLNRDTDALQFVEANDALRAWVSSTIAARGSAPEDAPDARTALDMPEPYSDKALDTMLQRFRVSAEDLALIMAARGDASDRTSSPVSPSPQTMGAARAILCNASSRSAAYAAWLRPVLVQWEWARLSYPPCTGKYGAMLLQTPDAVAVGPLFRTLFCGELLSRLDFRTLQECNQTLDDTLSYDAMREKLYHAHVECALRRERQIALVAESPGITPDQLAQATAAIDARNAEHLRQQYETLLGRGNVSADTAPHAQQAAQLLMDTTMREHVTTEMVTGQAPTSDESARAILVLCARDAQLCPPFLVARRAALRPWGADGRLVAYTQVRALPPARCVPVCYSDLVSRVIMQQRPINRALRGIAPSTLASGNALDPDTGALRDVAEIRAAQRHLHATYSTPRHLALRTPVLTPQLLACIDALPYRTLTDAALSPDAPQCPEDALNSLIAQRIHHPDGSAFRPALRAVSAYARASVFGNVKC